MGSLLIPLQLLIVTQSENLGRLGKAFKLFGLTDTSYLIALLVILLVVCIFLSIASNILYQKTVKRLLSESRKKKGKLKIQAVRYFLISYSEKNLITIILVVFLANLPTLAVTSSVMIIVQMLLVETFFLKNREARSTFILSFQFLFMVILFLVIVSAVYVEHIGLMNGILLLLLSRILTESSARLETHILEIPLKKWNLQAKSRNF